MSYNEIYELLYGESGHEYGENNSNFAQLSPQDKRAWKVLQFFLARKGFGDWWGRIKSEIQDEIFDDLRKRLEEIASGAERRH